jgi:hypothetical protein
MVEIERGNNMTDVKKKPNFTGGEIPQHPMKRPPLPGSDLDRFQKAKAKIQATLNELMIATQLNNRYKIVIADTAAIIKKQMLAQGSSEAEADKGVDGYLKRVELILKGGKTNV